MPFVLLASCASDDGISRDHAARAHAEILCDLRHRQCECTTVQSDSYDACVDELSALLEQRFAEAEADGLQYNGDCQARLVSLFRDTVACTRNADLSAELRYILARPGCNVFHGATDIAKPCHSYPDIDADNCKPQLECKGGTCQVSSDYSLRSLVPNGAACRPVFSVCGVGHACIGEVCAPVPELGENCNPVHGCVPGYVCDTDTWTCVERVTTTAEEAAICER